MGEPSSSVAISSAAGADEGLGGGKRSDTGPLSFNIFLARWTKELKMFGAPSPILSGDDSKTGAVGGDTPVTFDGEFVVVKIVLEYGNYE